MKSVFRWAVENDLMETNPAEDVRQQTAKASRNRETSYTDAEAIKQLACARTYQPKQSDTGAVLENKKVTAAKRWIPMLCAHTGARVTELAQLRREDIRQEGDIWVIRITPEAGSVKTNQYRDVPLHQQITSLGFLNHVNTIASGPLFHMSPKPELNRRYAQKMTNRLRDWLHEAELVPDGMQPFHAWRHRFKTVGLELGISERVLDAIQGHAPSRSSETYGNVTLKARADAIARFPAYPIEPGEHASSGNAAPTSVQALPSALAEE